MAAEKGKGEKKKKKRRVSRLRHQKKIKKLKNKKNSSSRHQRSQQQRRETRESERRLTFAVGVIVSQRAEAIPAHAAASCLQVHAVGVLHAAVALRAEVMTCRRRRDEKVALSGGVGGEEVTLLAFSCLFIYGGLSRNERVFIPPVCICIRLI